ncbi:MAG: hypothetical protein ACRET0_01470 [Steroidobacteraceae bacterium]
MVDLPAAEQQIERVVEAATSRLGESGAAQVIDQVLLEIAGITLDEGR